MKNIEREEAVAATEVRNALSHREKKRLGEITKHADKLRKGRRHDPKQGSWLSFPPRHVQAHSATMATKPQRCWMNNVYAVQGYEIDGGGQEMTLLVVTRHDEKPIRGHWSVLQRIKEELLGDLVGVELYPDRRRLIPVTSYALWVFKEEIEFPFGLHLPGYCIPAPKQEEVEEGEEVEDPEEE